MKTKEFPLKPSTIETVDMAMYDWLNNQMDLFTTTNKAWKKVPVVWIAGERSFQIKNDRDLRDENGTFILPVMTLNRISMKKDLNKKGIVWAALPEYNDFKGGTIEISKVIQQEKTSNFLAALNKRSTNRLDYPSEPYPENAILLEDGGYILSEEMDFLLSEDEEIAKKRYKDKGQLYYPTKNEKTVYQHISIPIPVYITMNYEIIIKTQFQQQMNELLQPFMTISGGVNRFYISQDGHKYEAFMSSDFNVENTTDNFEQNERIFSSKINIEVLSYLIGQDKNQIKPKIVIRESVVDVKISKERVIFGDIPKIKQTR